MSRKCLMEKAGKKPKFSTRKVNRCPFTGRARAYLRFFGMSRLEFRRCALFGLIPGLKKASW